MHQYWHISEWAEIEYPDSACKKTTTGNTILVKPLLKKTQLVKPPGEIPLLVKPPREILLLVKPPREILYW